MRILIAALLLTISSISAHAIPVVGIGDFVLGSSYKDIRQKHPTMRCAKIEATYLGRLCHLSPTSQKVDYWDIDRIELRFVRGQLDEARFLMERAAHTQPLKDYLDADYGNGRDYVIPGYVRHRNRRDGMSVHEWEFPSAICAVIHPEDYAPWHRTKLIAIHFQAKSLGGYGMGDLPTWEVRHRLPSRP
jgi:hypothetical protein